MFEFSVEDGFLEITENLVEMIKYLANEPSVGLYYIQQHAQKAVPNIIDRKNSLSDLSHRVTLETEDLEDSIVMLGLTKECGFSIADEMIMDIKKTLELLMLNNKEVIRRSIRHSVRSSNSTFQLGKGSFWGRQLTSDRGGANLQGNDDDDAERTGSYFSSAVKSAKQKAGNFKWPQLDFKIRGKMPSFPDIRVLASGQGNVSSVQDGDVMDKGSGNIEVDKGDECFVPDATKLQSRHRTSASDNFEEFKADRGARLEEWLKEDGSETDQKETDHV